jgi:hypothetical protein
MTAVVVGYATIDGLISGFVYDGASYTVVLDYPGAAQTYLLGINSSGAGLHGAEGGFPISPCRASHP